MQRKSFGHMQCPIAPNLDKINEWWSILIPHDAMRGLTRFPVAGKSSPRERSAH